MTWEVIWSPRALKELRGLDPQIKRRVVLAVDRFSSTGVGTIIRLTDVQPPEWRLRVGDWRVRFEKRDAQQEIRILRVLPRNKAY